MASVFGHALAAFTIRKSFSKSIINPKTIGLGVFCSIVPDADVIGFKFGIEYESFWGHRGFSHSLVFAILLSAFLVMLFYRSQKSNKSKVILFLYLFICTASHGLLDALTSGGRGVAFLSPWDNTRYFLPWRPIQVSPLGIDNFFSEWGLRVLQSELIWIGIPCLLIWLVIKVFRKKNAI